MIIVLKPNSTIEDIDHVEQMVTVRGLDTHVVHGTDMTTEHSTPRALSLMFPV